MIPVTELARDDEVVRELLAPLARVQSVTLGRGRSRHRLGHGRPLLGALVVAAALACTGIALAAGFGAFSNLSAAQGSQTGSDLLNPQTATSFEQLGCGAGQAGPDGTLVPYACDPSSAHLVSTLSNGDKLYVLADSGGHLCLYLQGAGLTQCGPPLDEAHPTWYTGQNASGDLLVAGVAMDGVSSVSFTLGGQQVTVPVENNAWAYENPAAPAPTNPSQFTFPQCLTAHFADGTTVVAQPGGCS